jgi:hypothetical protein
MLHFLLYYGIILIVNELYFNLICRRYMLNSKTKEWQKYPLFSDQLNILRGLFPAYYVISMPCGLEDNGFVSATVD